METSKRFLISIDLEDVRDLLPNGHQLSSRVPASSRVFLDYFQKHGISATFFVVGHVARRFPDLIRTIAREGHEIALHGDRHISLHELDRESFREDVLRNLDALEACGVDVSRGFRAPSYSLTRDTAWAHEVLDELGFHYSSSVMPALNPLNGWKEFGDRPRLMGDLWEIPATVFCGPGINIPFGGGIYFRLLPGAVLEVFFEGAAKAGRPVVGYFHPFDIDEEQERALFVPILKSRVLDALMYIGRGGVLNKVDRLIVSGWKTATYKEYLVELKSRIEPC